MPPTRCPSRTSATAATASRRPRSQDALRRIELCDAAAEILDPLAVRLQDALGTLRQVPQDLGEVYQLVYQFVRSGGKLPRYARWIEGDGAHV